MVRLCLDLNVWVGAYLSAALGRSGTAAQTLVQAVRTGVSPRGPIGLVISWGMLARLGDVLIGLGATQSDAHALIELIAAYALQGPSLTLGGVGVLPLRDEEDRHVFETALAGGADILVTHNMRHFVGGDVQPLTEDWHGAWRGGRKLLIAQTYAGAAWLRGEDWPGSVEAYMAAHGPAQG